METPGERIRRLRLSRQMSQEALAAAARAASEINFTGVKICRIELGYQELKVSEQEALLAVLGERAA